MIKKLMIGLAPLLGVAAFAVMPALAQAETKAYGTCVNTTEALEEHPPCPVGEKTFTAFGNGTPVKVLTEKTYNGGNFILKAPSGTIECEDLKDSGTVENVAGVGNSKETLIFTHCSAGGCRVQTAGAGAGVIRTEVTDKVLTETTVEIKVPAAGIVIVFSGSPGGCPEPGKEVGKVTGSVIGSQAKGSNDLVFAAAKGLKFKGEESELTGNDETYTEATGKPVVIN